MRKIIFLSFIILLFGMFGFDVNATSENKEEPLEINYQINREARAVWVSPLVNDIPRYTSINQYKSAINSVLDNMEKFNLNILIYHIRIYNDALYKSSYNNWSSYYNTNPDWEALPWIIEECHRRGIEFHAWMNPYRVASSGSVESVAKKFPKSNAASDPTNLLKGDSLVILNPGVPRVQNFLQTVVMEVVKNYDVDAIHFDDYFYVTGIDDSKTYATYGTGQGIEQFRRDSVDAFIKSLNNELKMYNQKNNKSVELGISPTAAWSNGDGVVTYDEKGFAVSNGSLGVTQGHYGNYLYCDTLKWVNEGWIDYIVPQCYIGSSNGNPLFEGTVEWWSKVCKNSRTKLYIGIGIYRASGEMDWSSKQELKDQFDYMSQFDNVDGYSIFSYRHLLSSNSNIKANLESAKEYYDDRVLAPEIRIDVKENSYEFESKNYYLLKENNIYKIGVNSHLNKYYIILKEKNNNLELLDICSLHEPFIDESSDAISYYIAPVLSNNKIGKYIKLDVNDVYSEVNIYGFNEKLISTVYLKDIDEVVLPEAEIIEGYDFKGWEKIGNNYKANYEIKRFKVTFYVNNEVYKVVEVNYNDSITAPDFESYGGSFSGFKGNLNNIKEDLDIFATYNPKKVSVKLYNGNDLIKSIQYFAGDSVVITDTVEAPIGKTFIGFFYKGEKVSEFIITENMNLYARFEDIIYKLNYNLNGGTASIKDEILYDEEYILPNVSKEGYSFIGWYANDVLIEKVKNPSNDLILEAKFEKLIFNISYKGDYDFSDLKKTLEYNEEYSLPELQKDGYNFLGFYSNGKKIEKVINQTLELEARFEKISNGKYTITYNLDGGECDNLINEFENSDDITLPIPTKKGYKFIGWYDENDLLVSSIENKNYVLTAKWEKVSSGCNNVMGNIYILIAVLGMTLLKRRK